MNAIQRVFGKSRVFLPVIHAQSRQQVRRNAELARINGADGVFLISHGSLRAFDVFRLAEELTTEYPNWWIGINILGSWSISAIFEQLRGDYKNIHGLWQDDAGVFPNSTPEWNSEWAEDVAEARGDWNGAHMGGVAFKYQREVPPNKWAHVAKLATSLVDVVVTSGEATGQAAPSEKLRVMREAIGDHALGLASGVTIENVEQYPGVNAFLVASSILLPGTGENFDPGKLREMGLRIHQAVTPA